jgi:hypothetical protein
MNQDYETKQENGDDESEDTWESTWSSDIKEDDLDYPKEVFHLGQACQDKL